MEPRIFATWIICIMAEQRSYIVKFKLRVVEYTENSGNRSAGALYEDDSDKNDDPFSDTENICDDIESRTVPKFGCLIKLKNLLFRNKISFDGSLLVVRLILQCDLYSSKYGIKNLERP